MDRTSELNLLLSKMEADLKPFSSSRNQDPLTIGSFKSLAEQAKKALAKGDTSLNNEERRHLEAILQKPILSKALNADSLPPTIVQKKLEKHELAAVHEDVKALKTLFKSKDQPILDKAQERFKAAMNRAMDLAAKPDELATIRENGTSYVAEKHSEKAILDRFYLPAIKSALGSWQPKAKL